MAGSAKRRACGEEGDSSNRTSANNETVQELVQVDFEGRNPDGQDFHGIKQLLQQLFLKAHIDLSQMSDMLIAQTGIGSVLKQCADDDDDDDDEDDEDDNMSDSLDVFGITSVINISSHREAPCIQQFLEILDEMCKTHADSSVQSQVNSLLSGPSKLGLLINERFVNIPSKICHPLFNCLSDEITRMGMKDKSYKFDYYIMICKIHKPKGDKGELIFANQEEEIFDRESSFSFEFDVSEESDTSVSGKWTGDVELVPFRRVLFVDTKKFPEILHSIRKFVS